MALSNDQSCTVAAVLALGNHPVKASTRIYQSAFVGDDGAGRARGLVAGDPFLGIAHQNGQDNSSGAAGDKRVDVAAVGELTFNVTGVTGDGDVGDLVYASADNVLTKSSTGNTKIGRITQWLGSTLCKIEFWAVTHLQV